MDGEKRQNETDGDNATEKRQPIATFDEWTKEKLKKESIAKTVGNMVSGWMNG